MRVECHKSKMMQKNSDSDSDSEIDRQIDRFYMSASSKQAERND